VDRQVWRLEVFMVMKIHVTAFWIVTSCSDMVGYQCFREPFCLHLEGEMITSLHGVTTQKTVT
jgi:hypothetical protein